MAFATISFTSMLRQGSLVSSSIREFDPSRHMSRHDIVFVSEGIKLSHKWAKCEQAAHAAEHVTLPKLGKSPLCPVKAIKRLLKSAPTTHNDQPLITFRSGKAMPTSFIRKRWAEAVKIANITDKRLSMHAIRKGSADYLLKTIGDMGTVTTYGRWSEKSKAARRYVKNSAQDKAIQAFERLKRD